MKKQLSALLSLLLVLLILVSCGVNNGDNTPPTAGEDPTKDSLEQADPSDNKNEKEDTPPKKEDRSDAEDTHTHTYKPGEKKKPTKTEPGYTVYKCIYCSDSYHDDFVSPIGSSGLSYEVNGDQYTCTITGIGDCKDTEIYIPQKIGSYAVTAIGSKAFAENETITKIVFPLEDLKEIGTRAFYKCTGLTEIHIPASVTAIGSQIFYKADNLKTVYYDSAYAPTEETVFLNQPSITKVVFGGSTVPAYICYHGTNIKEVEFTDKVTRINQYAFDSCTGLTEVKLPQSVTTMEQYAFNNCSGLRSATISSGAMKSKPANSASIHNFRDFFANCTNLTTVIIADGITTIPAWAFQGCDQIEHIVIPEGVTKTEILAFDGLDLKSITIPSTLKEVQSGWDDYMRTENVNISSLESWCTIKWASRTPLFYGGPFSLILNGSPITELEIPNTITTINENAFRNCASITKVTIPDSVISIGKSSFENCENLKSVTIPDSVTTIGESAFSVCAALTEITIPDSVATIGSGAFYSCDALSNIYFYGSPEEFRKIQSGFDLKNVTVYYHTEAGWVTEKNFN
ncbi:MAG: leucine-rich repeat domain-containing protein [Clostridia bacterium]|nr:leucine-rich repeat domain-containing protein [Clostridia bacterium]